MWRERLRDGELTAREWEDVLDYGDQEFHQDLSQAAANLSAPGWVIDDLVRHPSLAVRLAAVRHPNCPASTLIRFLDDTELSASAAHNPTVPVTAIEARLRRCEEGTEDQSRLRGDVYFLTGASTNSSLGTDTHCQIAETAAIIHHGAYRSGVHTSYAQNRDTAPAVLSVVYQHSGHDRRIGFLLAQNPNCPPSILSELSYSRYPDTQDEVVRNPSCPPDVLERRSSSARERVRVLVASHPNASPEFLERMWSTTQNRTVRDAIVKNPNCSDTVKAAHGFLT